MSTKWIRALFVVAGFYDGLLGVAFVFFWRTIFRHFDVEPPNHPGYVQFPALLLIVFAAMFLRVARDPLRNRELILYGMGLKLAFSGTAFWYELTAGIPRMWIPWAWADLGFLLLFLLAWLRLSAAQSATPGDVPGGITGREAR